MKGSNAANVNCELFLNSAATSYSLRSRSIFLSATLHLNAYFKTQNARTTKPHKAEFNRHTEDTKTEIKS